MIRRRWPSGCLALALLTTLVFDVRREIRSPVSAQAAAPAAVAIRGGTVITVTRGTIPNGTVLIRDGKIAAVGTNIQIPAGADVYVGRFADSIFGVV